MWLLTILSQGSKPALDGSSVSTKGNSRRIDVPMRAFAGGYYENLRSMYDWMGVRYHAQRFLFGFSALTAPCHTIIDPLTDPSLHFIHSSNNHRLPPLKPPHMSYLSFAFEALYLLLCYVWFTICCFAIEDHPCETFGEYLQRTGIPERFTAQYLLPLISSVATCSFEEMQRFPARDVIRYKVLTTGQHHFVLSQGMQQVQEILTRDLDIRLQMRVSRVTNSASGITVSLQDSKSGYDGTMDFDKVVLAVPPNVVGQILPQLSEPTREIPTRTVRTVVFDTGSCKSIPVPESDTTDAAAQVIHFRTSSQFTEAIHYQSPHSCVITQPLSTSPATESASHTSTFTRVLRTVESRRIVNRHFASSPSSSSAASAHSTQRDDKKPWRSGDDGIFVAGGWVWDGMVLLEGCVVSAMRVADKLGVEIPWRRYCRDPLLKLRSL